MDMYYTSQINNVNEEYIKGTYIGSDPNLKYQKCFIINEKNNKFKVRFTDDYVGSFEVFLNKKDIFLQ